MKRKNEHPIKFKTREHCGLSCSRTNPQSHELQRKNAEAKRLAKTKPCEVCGKSFCRDKDEATKTFDARTVCSRVCTMAKKRQKLLEEIEADKKICKVCGNEFTRKIYADNSVESPAKFKGRGNCSSTCGRTSRLKNHGWKRKAVKPRPLPPVKPPRDIPPPPPTPPREVWRPANMGRDVRPKLNV